MQDQYKAKEHYQTSDVAQAYDAERFTRWHGRMAHRLEQHLLEWGLQTYCRNGGAVLDLPCGTARLFDAYTADRFRVTGADISEDMLDMARQRCAGHDHFAWQRCDAEDLPFEDGVFDIVVSFRLMCHLPVGNRRRVLAEMRRVASKYLLINYHFETQSPIVWFNRAFRSQTCSPYPMKREDLPGDIEGLGLRVHDMKRLSWLERSSMLVVLECTSNT